MQVGRNRPRQPSRLRFAERRLKEEGTNILGTYLIDQKKNTKFTKIKENENEKVLKLFDKKVLENFTPEILGLGDVSTPSKPIDVICAFLDLTGFTHFCKQVDPHLSVPDYLNRFLNFLFSQIKAETLVKSYDQGDDLYNELPFFVKFNGDGVLLLWNVNSASKMIIGNVIATVSQVILHYKHDFFPSISKDFVDAPAELRAGLARGTIYSVGNGEDYIGPAMNIAARLQKVAGVSMAICKRGIDLSHYDNDYIVKRMVIRGIGDNELIYLRSYEFEELAEEDKKQFRNP